LIKWIKYGVNSGVNSGVIFLPSDPVGSHRDRLDQNSDQAYLQAAAATTLVIVLLLH